jgi:hypothetical protein
MEIEQDIRRGNCRTIIEERGPTLRLESLRQAEESVDIVLGIHHLSDNLGGGGTDAFADHRGRR